MRVVIMRGIPGAGKSTWVRDNMPGALIASADHYYTGPDGVYRFDPNKIRDAHNYCLREFLTHLMLGGPQDLVVDNTNVKVFEVAPYYRLAEAFGREVEVVWVDCTADVAAARTVHGVPLETVLRMAWSFEPLPPWWKVTLVR
jgi:predicted kinase